MCAFSPVPAVLLDQTTRPEETAETMSPFLMAGQLATLRQGPPMNESIRLWGQPVGVDLKNQGEFPDVSSF